MNDARATRVPFADLSKFGGLFLSYVADFDSVAQFYTHDWRDPGARAEAAERAVTFARDRETLVTVLREQNQRWKAREGSLANIERLLDPNCSAVVTGQQVGLFVGPMYTILKTVTAIQLARDIERQTGQPCVPVFWLEGEDHDFEEASATYLPAQGELSELRLKQPAEADDGNTGPVGRIELGQQIGELIDTLEELIPPTDFRNTVVEALRQSYQSDLTLRDAFAALMRRLFPDQGLVFCSPDDVRFKRILRPLFRREIASYDESFELLNARTTAIGERFTPQLHPSPLNLFMMEEEGRFRLAPGREGKFQLKGVGRTFTERELLEILDTDPCRYSPNVVMRPISQDTLLPTAAYVAGPGEISYFAQLGPVYEWAGVPMPTIYPRASATLVEPPVRRALDKLELDITDLSEDADSIIRQQALAQMDVDLDGFFEGVLSGLDEHIASVSSVADSIDVSLVKSVDSARAGVRKQMEGLKAKLVRAAKRNHEQVGRTVEKAAHGVFPGGKLQERVVSPIYFAGKHGLDLPEALIERLSLETDQHQVLDL